MNLSKYFLYLIQSFYFYREYNTDKANKVIDPHFTKSVSYFQLVSAYNNINQQFVH